MKLLTKEIEKKLPALQSTEGQYYEAVAQVKFFTPDANWTWYGVEYDPDEQLFYGLVDGFEKELGYFSLAELLQVRGALGLPIERDMYFDPQPIKNFM